jgi:uncharacterized protein (DUF1697 family)
MIVLRELLGGLGHRDVVTYIQSGNVVFEADGDSAGIVRSIEGAISDEVGLDVVTMLRTPGELADAAAASPYAASADPKRVAIAFLGAPPLPDLASAVDPAAHHPDQFEIVGREVHLHCPTGFGRSKLNNAWLEQKLGVVSTTRNWNTVNKLLDICQSRTG